MQCFSLKAPERNELTADIFQAINYIKMSRHIRSPSVKCFFARSFNLGAANSSISSLAKACSAVRFQYFPSNLERWKTLVFLAENKNTENGVFEMFRKAVDTSLYEFCCEWMKLMLESGFSGV